MEKFACKIGLLMNTLKDWIKSLIERPIGILNAEYPQEHLVREKLDSFGYMATSSDVSSELLQNLHDKIFGQSCEEAIWDAVLWYLAHPLPISVAHELIDRGVSTVAMGHTRQFDEIQWRLATFSEYALYYLIMERYIDNNYSTLQFEVMLNIYNIYRNREGILYMLSFYETPSSEKQAIFDKAVALEQARLNESNDDELESD